MKIDWDDLTVWRKMPLELGRFGEWLWMRLQESDCCDSFADLAEQTGLGISTIYSYLRCERYPSIHSVARIIHGLGMDRVYNANEIYLQYVCVDKKDDGNGF